MLVSGRYLADRYEIIENIGSGGMSDVYKAKDHKLNRLVAVKVLKNEYSQDAAFVRKFRVEAQSAAGLSHPNIVGVYDVGEEDGINYIVMELIQGITLKKYIEMKGKLEIREALNISIQIASGLSAAHQNRIIHRDIKPQNIIMSKDGKVKVTDFGIAKVADSTTVTTTAAGSVHYISPEQARGGYSDARSDIYSLGITMYEMITGRVPFDGETNVAVALQHIQGEMTPPRQLDPTIPRSFEKIILKCTQKKPDRRYASAKELIADLRRVLAEPDGNYVMLGSSVADASTVVMDENDLRNVRRQNVQSGQNAQKREPASKNGVQRPPQDDYMRRQNLKNQEPEEDDEDDDKEVNPALEKVMLVLGIVGAIILVVVVAFIIGRAAGLFGGSTNDTETVIESESESESESETESDAEMKEVPEVIGSSEATARQTLAREGFTNITVEEGQSDDYDEGQVYDQSPRGGLTVATDTEITIYVSSGSETFQLEDYSGDTAEQVQTALTALNLIPNLTYEYSDDVQEGRVISTDPEPGTEVSEGDRITVVISSGAEQVTVPYVIDQTEAAATQRLRDAGFSVTTQSFESNKTAGTVADVVYNGSSVSGGTAPSGATLTLLISTGPAQTQETQAQTVTQSEDLGLDFGDDENHTVSVSINGGSERSLGTFNNDTVGNCRVTISGRPGNTITVEVFVDGESIGQRTFTINEG